MRYGFTIPGASEGLELQVHAVLARHSRERANELRACGIDFMLAAVGRGRSGNLLPLVEDALELTFLPACMAVARQPIVARVVEGETVLSFPFLFRNLGIEADLRLLVGRTASYCEIERLERGPGSDMTEVKVQSLDYALRRARL